MSPAGINLHFDQRELAKRSIQAPDHVVVRDRVAPSGSPRRHPYAAPPVAADAGRDGSAIFLQPPVHQRNVIFFTSRPANCAASLRCASSFFATTISPLVSLSSRCTMPGRISPPTAERLAK